MSSVLSSLTPHRAHFSRLTLALVFLAICLGSGFPQSAQSTDNIGIFWDTDYTQDATAARNCADLNPPAH